MEENNLAIKSFAEINFCDKIALKKFININIIFNYILNYRGGKNYMSSVGICMGASNIKVVETSNKEKELEIINYSSQPHEGNAKRTLEKILQDFDFEENNNFAVTGRKFKNFVNLPSIAEPEATELAYNYLKGKYGEVEAIVSAGGETFMVYELDEDGKIADVHSGNKCASGTGEFFYNS